MIIYCMLIYKHASGVYEYCSIFYIAFIYTVHMLKAWPLLTATIVLIGQSLIMCAQFIHCILSQNTTLIYHYIPLLLMLHHTFYWLLFVIVQIPCLHMFEEHFDTQQYSD